MLRDNREILEDLFRNGIIKIKRGSIFDIDPDPMPSDFDFGRFEGMMLGLAIGDALGNTTEGMLPDQRYHFFKEIRDYLPNKHAHEKRVGTSTDDTQLAFWTLECLIENDGLIPEYLANRFCKDRIYGIGATVRRFIANRKSGKDWTECGPHSAGNGALMRIAPIIFPHLRSGGRKLWADTAISAMLTHNDTASISSCISFVNIFWELLKMNHTPPQEWWVATYLHVARDLELESNYKPRSKAVDGFSGSLSDFVEQEVLSAYHKGKTVKDACGRWYSGAYLLETVPAALLILMKHCDDPEEAIVRAVNDTKDNDTIAAIVGTAVGALHGKEKFPEKWVSNLSGRTKVNDDGQIFRILNEAENFWNSNKPSKRTNYKSCENAYPIKQLPTVSIKSGKISKNCELLFYENSVMAKMTGETIAVERLIEEDFFTTFQAVQKKLKPMDLSLRVCGQCKNFAFSSMAYQMSGGEAGYCRLIKGSQSEGKNVVNVLDSCDAFIYREKSTEYSPWLPP